MNTDPTHIAICAENATRQPGPPIGPCVLRPQHQGRIHQDVRGVQWSTPVPAPAAGGVIEDALAVVGETSTGCTIPPRTPDGQRTRTRLGAPDGRVQDGADTAPTKADAVRAAINRAFDIPTGRTPDTPGQDPTRTRSATARADTGRQDEHGM